MAGHPAYEELSREQLIAALTVAHARIAGTWSKTPGKTIADGRRGEQKPAEILAFARTIRPVLHLHARGF